MASFGVTLRGIDEFRATMKGLYEDMAGILEEAVTDGSMVVVRAAQENSKKGGSFPRRITGNLYRSIPAVSPAIVSKSKTRVEMAVGSAAEYALRLEKGFTDTDSRGRRYHQAPRPFIVPALENNTDAVEAVIRAKLLKTIERYIR